jgi:FADH2 O2-dependent halogenase
MIDVDVVIVGSGFAGSLTAMALRRLGQTVAVVERGRHPRFAIGESSTPLANLLLEEFADRYDLPVIRAFSKWGTWQRTHPEVACGLKRGFSFLFHRHGEAFADTAAHDRQLLVAASPHDDIADTHWYRPDFDHALCNEARRLGAIFLDGARIDQQLWSGDRVTLDGVRDGQSFRVRAGFLVDASGPRGFLHRAMPLPETPLRWLPRTEAIYSHFEDLDRWDQAEGRNDNQEPPFPVDDAALHHVFPGGWIWILRFNNGITSAGAALTTPLAARLGASEGAAAWVRLMTMLPSVGRQCARARATMPFVYSPAVAFRSGRAAGRNWALLPSAAGVIDPLLSTGFPLTLLGVGRLVEILGSTTSGTQREEALRHYEAVTLDELEITERLVAALYATMHDPELFKRLALLYFAAASFSEAARRLGRPERAPGFLLSGNTGFAAGLRRCAEVACLAPHGELRQDLLTRINMLVEPFDAAGLLDRSRRDWYPVQTEDLLASASKFDVTADDIYGMLARCGFAVSHHSSKASAGGPTRNSA